MARGEEQKASARDCGREPCDKRRGGLCVRHGRAVRKGGNVLGDGAVREREAEIATPAARVEGGGGGGGSCAARTYVLQPLAGFL